jgi:two-component system response regulator HydG
MNSGPVIHITDLPGSIVSTQARAVSQLPGKIVPVADLERQAILGAIAQLNGDKLSAAKLLGIGKTTLYRKLKEYDHPEV